MGLDLKNQRWGVDARLPPFANKLYRELCSCAIDAELARLTGTWDTKEMEKRATRHIGYLPAGTPERKTFSAMRGGGRPQASHVERLQRAYPNSRIKWCWLHPLAKILCDPNLSQDDINELLSQIPNGQVRRQLWDEGGVTMLTGFRVRTRQRWEPRRIQRLVEIATPAALLALVGRMRISQLQGDAFYDDIEEDAIWLMLPRCVVRSNSLILGQDALLLAIDFFLSWQPYCELRFPQMERKPDFRNEALHKLSQLQAQAVSTGHRVPADQIQYRKARATEQLLPPVPGNGPWWE